MGKLLAAAYALIALDFGLTRCGITWGVAAEGNPLLIPAMSCDWAAAAGLLLIGCLILWTYAMRRHVARKIYLMYWAVILSRAAVIAYHIRWLVFS